MPEFNETVTEHFRNRMRISFITHARRSRQEVVMEIQNMNAIDKRLIMDEVPQWMDARAMTAVTQAISSQCVWLCPECSTRCGGSTNHNGSHQCEYHYTSKSWAVHGTLHDGKTLQPYLESIFPYLFNAELRQTPRVVAEQNAIKQEILEGHKLLLEIDWKNNNVTETRFSSEEKGSSNRKERPVRSVLRGARATKRLPKVRSKRNDL